MDRRTPGIAAHACVALATAASLVACGSQGDGDVPELSQKSVGARGTTPKKCTVSSQLVPSCGAWWGFSPAVGGGQVAAASVRSYERQSGRPGDVYHGYHAGTELIP